MWLHAEIRTLADIPRHYRRHSPDKAALIDGDTQVSFAQLDEISNRIANALHASGVTPASHVGFIGKNSARYFESLFGVSKHGCALVPLNWRLAPPELAQVIDDSRPALVLVDREFEPLLAAVLPLLSFTPQCISFDGVTRSGTAFEAWLAPFSGDDPQLDVDPRQTALLMYTSGTTGRPKGAQISHQNLNYLRLCEHLEPALRWSADDVMLTVMPNFHLVGTGLSLQALYNGSSLTMLGALEPGQLLKLIARDRPTVCALVPTAIQMVLDHPDCASTDLSSLRLIMYAGSPIGAALLRRALSEMRCQFMQFYGATETAGAVTLLRPEQHQIDDERKLRSCGTPLPLIEVRIVDASGQVLPPGQIGEMLVRSPALAQGYWQQPAVSAETFVDGWYHTGDVGLVDDEGLLYIVDRAKDMIVSGGENVYSTEVEQALAAHPAVNACAVIGLPDSRWGEKVAAVVVRVPDADLSAEALIQHCRTRIAGYKLPKTVVFVEALPMSPSGKILKRVLREQLQHR